MGTGDLTGKTGLPDDADAIVTAYLSRLDAALPLTAAERDRIVAEATDALICATQTRIRAGEEPAAAATAAVAEFGDPAMLARQFAAALAPRMARRVGLTLIGSGPLVGLCWVAAIGSGPGLVSRIASALSVMSLLPVVLVFSVPAAAIAVLAGANPLRRPALADAAPRAARVAAFGCVCADALLITTAAGQLVAGRWGLGGVRGRTRRASPHCGG